MDNYSVVYGAYPKFEVEIISHEVGWGSSLGIGSGVMRCEKSVPIESIPSDAYGAVNHSVWSSQLLWNSLFTSRGESEYGYVNLSDLRQGDRVGLYISRDGVLEFTVNGESQGIAAKNVYTRDTDIYAVVDHRGNCVATTITKSGNLFITLQSVNINYYCYFRRG